MEDYYEYLDSNGVTTLYKLIKDDTVALIDSYSVTVNGITTTLDTHINNSDIHTPISDIENMVDTKISGLVNSAPETLDTLKELSDALGNDPNFATTIANQIGNKANSVHSHVVSDITDFPTIPTKTSELINDSGFLTSSSGLITSVSWSDIKDKPNFSTVATSGSYTDLSNTPTIPTKVSQLENDTGFINALTDVVDTKSNQTINGTKTFTSGPWVTNNHNTTGYSIKNTALARNDIPTEYQHYTFRAYDKNNKIMGEYCIEKATTGDALLSMNVRSEDSSGTQISYGMQFRMTNDGSLVRFMPSANNKVHLGDVGAKWASVHATNAHVTYTYTNRVTTYSITHPTDDSYFFMSGGTDYNKGATLYLGGISATNFTPGRFALSARKTDGSSIELAGSPNGTLTWDGKSLAIDENLVHRSGNETINGIKTFTSSPFVSGGGTTTGIYLKNTAIARNEVPSITYYSVLRTLDKNNKILGDYVVMKTDKGVTNAQINIRSEDSNGNQLINALNFSMSNDNSSVSFAPSINNKVSLGTSTYKWANAHINKVTCTRFTHSVNNGSVYITGGSEYDKGATLVLHGDESDGAGSFIINSRDKTRSLYLVGKPDGTLQWAGQNIALDDNLVHRSGDETISGTKIFTDNICKKNSTLDLQVNPSSTQYNSLLFTDKNNAVMGYLEHLQTTTGVIALGLVTRDKNNGSHGIQVTSEDNVIPLGNGVVNLGLSGSKWKNVYATTFNGNLKGNADTSTSANSATYATTQATSDNSTKIATTAWVRTYVNSVAGSNTVGSSVSAYWSNSSNVTATGQSSSGGYYPSCYSEYITKTPTVGTIYSGAQLYTVLNTYASATASTTGQNGSTKVTNITAQATFSNPVSSTGKYLCTTANTVKFRAYVTAGNSSSLGTASVVDNSSTKSIFIRVE